MIGSMPFFKRILLQISLLWLHGRKASKVRAALLVDNLHRKGQLGVRKGKLGVGSTARRPACHRICQPDGDDYINYSLLLTAPKPLYQPKKQIVSDQK